MIASLFTTLALIASSVSAQTLTCSSPVNATYAAGSPMAISWTLSGGDPTALVGISIQNRDSFIMPFGQGNIDLVTDLATSSSSYSWVVSSSFSTAPNYRIRVWGKTNGFDCYSPWFSILNSQPPPSLFTVNYPPQGASFALCSTVTISWSYPLDNAMPANLYAKIHSASSKAVVYQLPDLITVKSGSYTFLVPDTVPLGNNAYFLSFWKEPSPLNLTPGYAEKFGANSNVFSVIPSPTGNNTCPPPPPKPKTPNSNNNDNSGGTAASRAKASDNAASDSSIPGFTITLIVALLISRIFF